MNSWKIVGQIASGFGIVFVIFAALEAFINYQAITMQSAFIPSGYLQVYILSAMLPFLLFAVLSFIVAAAIMRSGREEAGENMTAEPQPVEPEA